MAASPSALSLAHDLLAQSLPRRFDHVAGVAQRVEKTCVALGLEGDSVVAAAWLHDIGYAPFVANTGFHALDGARHATREGFGGEIAALVAHHSCALIEAEIRGMAEVLQAEFPEPTTPLAQILTAADMSVGPSGTPMTIDARLADIRSRYVTDGIVTRFVNAAEPSLRRARAEVEDWLAQSQ